MNWLEILLMMQLLIMLIDNANTNSFKLKEKMTGQTGNNGTIKIFK